MAPAAKSTASEGRSPILQLQQLKIRRDGGNANSTTRGTDRRWAIGSNHCAIRVMEQIAQCRRIQSRLGTSLRRDSPDSTLESRIQCPPLQGQAIFAWHPNPHQGAPVPMPNNADSGYRRLTGFSLRNPLENHKRSSNSSPPSSRAGSLLWLLRRAAGNPLAASAALRNQTVSVLDAAGRGSRCCARLAPRSLSSAVQRAESGRPFAQCAVVGPVLRSLGRGAACSADGPRRGRAAGAREWTPTNAITRWRMQPVHMAIALTRQVIQCQCQ